MQKPWNTSSKVFSWIRTREQDQVQHCSSSSSKRMETSSSGYSSRMMLIVMRRPSSCLPNRTTTWPWLSSTESSKIDLTHSDSETKLKRSAWLKLLMVFMIWKTSVASWSNSSRSLESNNWKTLWKLSLRMKRWRRLWKRSLKSK